MKIESNERERVKIGTISERIFDFRPAFWISTKYPWDMRFFAQEKWFHTRVVYFSLYLSTMALISSLNKNW